jgi:hypothetical protein
MIKSHILNKPVLVKLRAYEPKPGTVVGIDNDGFWIRSPELVAELHKVDQPPKPNEAVIFVPTAQLDWVMATLETGKVKVSELSPAVSR